MEIKIKSELEKLSSNELDKTNELLKVLDDMGMNDDTKLKGVLYFLLKHDKINFDYLKTNYNQDVIDSVSIITKLDKLNYSEQETEAENLRKMFFAITKDIRIIMLKIACVVIDLRYSNDESEENKKSLANSILCLFAPLSARLGLSGYKTELEDGAFKINYPEKAEKIQSDVDNRFHKRQPIVDRLTSLVENCLKELNIEGRVFGRKKHIYSIYKKLQNHKLDNIYDLIAVRAIVKTIPDCYAILGRLHSLTEPMQNRFKDYIAIPKPNGYQSLHTTVIFEGFPVEIQIRTEDMHNYAEYGIAAHWIYKEKRKKQDNLDVQLSWIRQMMENDDLPIDDLVKSLDQDIYDNEIFVQSPKGKVIYMPNGSTPIDFAYNIHSAIGNQCVGAKVNGKMVPVTTELKNGDTVEIITNPNSKGPSRDWLKICKTSEARNKINSFFKKNIKEETINLGRTMLETAIRDKGYSVTRLLTKSSLEKILKHYNYTEENEFYANLGTNAISAKLIANRLANEYQKETKIETTTKTLTNNISINLPSEKQISVKGLNNVLVKFAGCCHPMYGDDIIGFVSTGRGIIIHRSICPNTNYFRDSRLIEVKWKPLEEKPKKKQ